MDGIAGEIREMAHSVHPFEQMEQNGVLQRVFEELQQEGIIEIKVESVCMDSATVKVHTDRTGALKHDAPEGIAQEDPTGKGAEISTDGPYI